MGRLFKANGHSHGTGCISFAGLPALESLAPPASDEKEKVALILRLLRQAAVENRETKSLQFYSIRSVAKHFTLPTTTVTRMYARLKQEGLLASVWGSKTFVEPTHLDRELRVRGVIGLPVSLAPFCSIRNHRKFFLSVREALWRVGFATRLVFYEAGEAEEPSFVEQLVSCGVDAVIWLLPASNVRRTSMALNDRGIRVVTLSDSFANPSEYRYHLRREVALLRGLTQWKKEGITSVIVAHAVGSDSIGKVAAITVCLRGVGIQHVAADIESMKDAQCRLTLFNKGNCGIIFASSELALRLLCEDRIEFTKLASRHHILLIDGMIESPAGAPLQELSDAIEFDWEPVTRRIANDLVNPVRPSANKTLIFEARWVRRQEHDTGT